LYEEGTCGFDPRSIFSSLKNSFESVEEVFFDGITLASEIAFLKVFEGKYPHDVNFLDISMIQDRLEKLVGEDNFDLILGCTVSTPIEIEDNIFYCSGCWPHECGSINYLISIDLKNNIMCVKIHDSDGNELKYSENGTFPYGFEER
jgi:hypothetical protein